ncbi:hypothetical protein H2203_007390 [Taxawa tesnikishii (nom. ined.)]|nr:hypothetical protein H2203_007390 [Dothideales sp. JES 119]
MASQDLSNLSLVSKGWDRVVREQLYGSIWLPSNQGTRDIKSLHFKNTSRLKLLLRTLQESPNLAFFVRHVEMGYDLRSECMAGGGKQTHTSTMIASIIKACPNLESVGGFYPIFGLETHEPIIEALATRTSLREHVWLLSPDRHSHSADSYGDGISVRKTSDPTSSLLRMHMFWAQLENLVIHGLDASTLGTGSVYGILRKLPSLQHLVLSNLPSHTCHDGTLQALPALASLRLDSLPGITDRGLVSLVSTHQPLTRSLRSFSLVDQNVKELRTLSSLLSSLPELLSFTFLQQTCPGLPLGVSHLLFSNPTSVKGRTLLLASSSLRDLHWDILIPGSATQALAQSIRNGGFPALEHIRAPADDGTLQAVCRPVTRLPLEEQEVREWERVETVGYSRKLDHARTGAQIRVRESRMRIAQEENGGAREKHSRRGRRRCSIL